MTVSTDSTDMPPQYEDLQEMETDDPSDEPFLTDYAQLETDTESYDEAVAEQQQSEANYDSAYQQIQSAIASGMDPEEVLMLLILLICEEGFQEQDAALNVQAWGLQIQGDLTNCGDDVQTQADSGSDDPETTEEVAYETDCMMAVLSPDSDVSWAPDLQSAIGSTASASLYGQYASIRSEFYIEGDGEYNPDPDSTYYFTDDPNDTTHMQTFGEMEDEMSTPGPYTQFAIDAAQMMTNAFNTNTSTTQSTQAASNEYITQDINQQKLTESFVVDLMKELADVTQAAVQNMGK